MTSESHERLFEEVKAINETQVSWLETIYQNIHKNLRFNLLFLSILIGAGTVAAEAGYFNFSESLNPMLKWGIVSMTSGIALSAIPYFQAERRFMVNGDEIIEILEADVGQQGWVESQLEDYAESIDRNEKFLRFKSGVLLVSQLLFIGSVILILSGILHLYNTHLAGLMLGIPTIIAVIALILELLYTDPLW
ncbi:hypothetical protein GKQ38_00680 [Candidatus Nanohaloarchaea archaeon]|nr:hypothetical protein GKQ38_00680 [Candidatus Nanohaloarchaea archaeon]